MRRVRRGLLGASSLVMLAVAGVHVPVMAGSTATFPGCGVTLQDCIDAAPTGGTVFVGTDTPIAEDVDISESLILEASPGSHPTLDGVSIFYSGSDVSVTVRGLTVTGGIDAGFSGGTGHYVAIRNVHVDQSSSAGAGISLSSSVPATFIVEGSRIHTESYQAGSIEFASTSSSQVYFEAVGNRIDQRGYATGGSGISVSAGSSGSVRADIYNNAIWDVARSGSGGAAGVSLYLQDQVVADVNLVGNTIEHVHGHGLGLRNDVIGPGHLALDVFDNIFSHGVRAAIYFDPGGGSTLTYRAGNNDRFSNDEASWLDGEAPGTDNLSVDPKYVDRAARNLRLKASSPLIDQGQICTPGGLGGPDALGHSRLFGKSVDVGAYEQGAGPLTGVVYAGGTPSGAQLLIGTAGADVICGYGGPDDIEGGGGPDYLDAGPGADFVSGGDGPDRMFGGPGPDNLCANDGHGNDRVDGGSGDDGYRVDAGDTRISLEHSVPC